jgi:tetratricopeptide (TPR) repeat protein
MRLPHWLMNRLLTRLANVLFGLRLTDEATGFKLVRADILRGFDLRCCRFEFCPEVVAKAGLAGVPIVERPIAYHARRSSDGKKIRWTDGIAAVATLVRWRLSARQAPTPPIAAVVRAAVVAIALATTGCRPDVRAQDDLDAMVRHGAALRDAARYGDARQVLRRALDRAEHAVGHESLEVAAILNQLGMVGKYDGHFDEAATTYAEALAITARLGLDRHPLTAAVLHNLGGLAHARGRFAEGEPYARRAVALRELLLGSAHPDTAADVAALAALVDGQGRYAEAEGLYGRALSVFERTNLGESIDAAVVHNNLAAIRQATGRRADAAAGYAKALAIKEMRLGLDHPDVATTANNLAVLCADEGQGARAGVLHRRALAIFERTLGPAHPKTIASRENLRRLVEDRRQEPVVRPLGWRERRE